MERRRIVSAMAAMAAMVAQAGDVSFVERPDYATAEAQSWSAIRAATRMAGVPQRTIHIPLGLPESDAVVYGDPAFNVFKLPVPADIRTRDPKSSEKIHAVRPTVLAVALVSFPDRYNVTFARAEGENGVTEAEMTVLSEQEAAAEEQGKEER